MKKGVFLLPIALLIALGLCGGCGSPEIPNDIFTENTPSHNDIVNEAGDIQIHTDFGSVYDGVADVIIAPAAYRIQAFPGDVIDTFVDPGYILIGDFTIWEAHIYFNAGDPFALALYNGYDVPCSFELEYADISGDYGHCGITGLDYSRAPEGAEQWVVIPSQILSVAPRCARLVPISIVLPEEGVKYPETWAFRVRVWNLNEPGNIRVPRYSRILITMK